MFNLKRFRFWFFVICFALLGIIVSVITYSSALGIRCDSNSAYPLEALLNTTCVSASPSQLFGQSLLWLFLLSVFTFCLSIGALAVLLVKKIMHKYRDNTSNND